MCAPSTRVIAACIRNLQKVQIQKMWRVFREFLQFLRDEKKWWLLPIVLVLLALAALIVFSGGSVFAPLLYPFM